MRSKFPSIGFGWCCGAHLQAPLHIYIERERERGSLSSAQVEESVCSATCGWWKRVERSKSPPVSEMIILRPAHFIPPFQQRKLYLIPVEPEIWKFIHTLRSANLGALLVQPCHSDACTCSPRRPSSLKWNPLSGTVISQRNPQRARCSSASLSFRGTVLNSTVC